MNNTILKTAAAALIATAIAIPTFARGPEHEPAPAGPERHGFTRVITVVKEVFTPGKAEAKRDPGHDAPKAEPKRDPGHDAPKAEPKRDPGRKPAKGFEFHR